MNERSQSGGSLSASFHLSFSTDLPFPAPYILFIYLQGDRCILQVFSKHHNVCVCVCAWKKTERRMRSAPWSVVVVQTRRRDLLLHLHDGTITQGGKEEERQAQVGYNVCKKRRIKRV